MFVQYLCCLLQARAALYQKTRELTEGRKHYERLALNKGYRGGVVEVQL